VGQTTQQIATQRYHTGIQL